MKMDDCDDLFSSWLAAREDGDPRDIEARDIETLCAAHPECAQTLRAYYAEWLRIEAVNAAGTTPELAATKPEAGPANAGPGLNEAPDPGLLLIPPKAGEQEAAAAPLLSRLGKRGAPKERFVVKEKIGRGGMGSVFRVYDSEIGRHVAAKVLHLDDPSFLPRFLEEAQTTGQLDHPVFIPVHDFAVDEKGRVFFTMKLVKGVTDPTIDEVRAETFSDVIDKIHAGTEGWTLTRGISEVITRVAEAMEFAHQKGVIHRDLKPVNILVGRYGEVYVTDFGIARVQGRERAPGIIIPNPLARVDAASAPAPGAEHAFESPSPAQLTQVRTERRDAIERGFEAPPSTANPISPGPTEDGAVIGTPEYMPPEQAEGRLSEIDARADIYALGATLYHLVAGIPPWHTRGTRPYGPAIVQRIRAGATPTALHELALDTPAELLAIVEKAMAAKPKDRYASMAAFAADLRAFLEKRVVSAYETGAIAELKKWIQRNPALAAAAGLLVLVLASATAIVTQQKRQVEAKNREVEAKNLALAAANEEITAQKNEVENQKREVETKSAEVTARKAEFDQLSGVVLLADAIQNESDLYPPWPSKITAMEAWLRNDAAKLLELQPNLEATLREIEGRASKSSGDPAPTWQFASDSDRFLHETLSKLTSDIAAFETSTKASVEQRLAWAKQIGELTLRHPNARVTWDEARAAILRADDVVASKLYAESPGGPIDLKPQMGLVPIGMNPVTKLWEFYELRSACDVAAGQDPATIEIPTHRADGSIEVKDETGIVFVLLPGGMFLQGAQKSDPNSPNFDPAAESDEAPQEVTLAPFFLARHELTRAQWFRLSNGEEPSQNKRNSSFPTDPIVSWTHPVESVDWQMSRELFARHDLTLPTEAQWEFGARGGTKTVWSTGDVAASLDKSANVLDLRAERVVPGWGRQQGDFDDGFVGACHVGSLRPNPYGLYDMHGNVWEWCLDAYVNRYEPPRNGDGLRAAEVSTPPLRVNRGGSAANPATYARSADRGWFAPKSRVSVLGTRPAKQLAISD